MSHWWVIVQGFTCTVMLEAFMNFICLSYLALAYLIFLRIRYFGFIWETISR